LIEELVEQVARLDGGHESVPARDGWAVQKQWRELLLDGRSTPAQPFDWPMLLDRVGGCLTGPRAVEQLTLLLPADVFVWAGERRLAKRVWSARLLAVRCDLGQPDLTLYCPEGRWTLCTTHDRGAVFAEVVGAEDPESD